MSWQNGLYIEALSDIEPRVLEAACKQIIRDGDRFPKPREIRDAAKELLERRDAARALSGPLAPPDIGSVMRNEALMLLGMFRAEASTILGDPSPEFSNFLAEAANAWSRVRPDGGLPEVDAQKGGRCIYGFAMEAWARRRLGALPLHPAFVLPRTAEVYRQMAGSQIETLRPEDDPFTGADYGLGAAAKRSVRQAAE